MVVIIERKICFFVPVFSSKVSFFHFPYKLCFSKHTPFFLSDELLHMIILYPAKSNSWSEFKNPCPLSAAKSDNPFSIGELHGLKKEDDLPDPEQQWKIFINGEFELWYIRDREKREVDALVTRDNQPWLMVEVKLNDLNLSKSLQRFSQLLNCRKIVQVVKPDGIYRQVKIDSSVYHFVSAGVFLRWLE